MAGQAIEELSTERDHKKIHAFGQVLEPSIKTRQAPEYLGKRLFNKGRDGKTM